MPTQILTDHKSLEYFMTTKKLSRRQARWAEFLSQYNFKITYRPEAANSKADALTRREDLHLTRVKEDPNINQTMLTKAMLSDEVIKDLGISTVKEEQLDEASPADVTATLADIVISANKADPLFKQLRTTKRTRGQLEGWRLASCENVNNILRYKGKVAVPNSLRRQVIQEVHSGLEIGHTGIKKTMAAIRGSYRWPTLYNDTKQFIDNCHDCRRSKPRHEAPAGLLTPLPIPDRPWLDIALDFVTGLPECEGNDAILMVVDRLSKERHYIACKAGNEGTSAERTAKLVYRHVWKHHGLPSIITSDRGPQFVSTLWKHLCGIMKVRAKLSTAFHPQTDGQSEISNAEIERYLRTFTNEY